MTHQLPSNHDLRLLIADLLGYKDLTYHDSVPGFIMGTDPTDGRFKSIPDWPADLNACHALEESIPPGPKWDGYWEALVRENDQEDSLKGVCHATARQRCLAFAAATAAEGGGQ